MKEIETIYSPEIICLQETKVQDVDFPISFCRQIGYEHLIYSGVPKYNGVAILSKHKISEHGSHDFCRMRDGRYLWAEIDGYIIHNFYVPSGGNIPSIDSEKFVHKLKFLEEMILFIQDYFSGRRQILVGDLNVAPLVEDVFDHNYMSKIVSHTPQERELLLRVQQQIGFTDIVREGYGLGTKVFSWWSYRALDWEVLNRGLRLDHVWTKDLDFTEVKVINEVRSWEHPSDHAPIFARVI